MNKAIFLDRDGTINIDYGYVGEISKFELIDGVIDALKLLQNLKFKLIIITNQSGIGRGYFTKEQYEQLTKYMLEIFHKSGINISNVYFCPHKPEDNCDCRKPRLKLFYKAIADFDIDINQSYVIGDSIRDLAICETENIMGILLTKKEKKVGKYICKKNLLEAAQYIEMKYKVNKYEK